MANQQIIRMTLGLIRMEATESPTSQQVKEYLVKTASAGVKKGNGNGFSGRIRGLAR
jgi:hypothetical protein